MFVKPGLVGFLSLLLAACGGGGGGGTDGGTPGGGGVGADPNLPPQVDAGTDQVAATGDTVTLVGTATDSDGQVTALAWTQIEGPPVPLTGQDSAMATFVAPVAPRAHAALLRFQLEATDDDGDRATDVVEVEVPMSGRVVFVANDENGARALYRRDLAASDPVRISPPFAMGGYVENFSIAPDGAHVAFQAHEDALAFSALYTCAPDGSEFRKVSHDHNAGGVLDYAWSPNSDLLAYRAPALERSDTLRHIHTVHWDGTGRVRVSQIVTELPVGEIDLGLQGEFAWAPDGSRLAYVQRISSGEALFTARPDGTEIARANRPLGSAGDVGEFAWSPDSSRIAYLGDQSTDDYIQLYTSLADGSGNATVSGGRALGNGTWAWSPSGQRLAYIDPNLQTGFYGSYLVIRSAAADGSDRVTYARDDARTYGTFLEAAAPQWAPDGSQLFCTYSKRISSTGESSVWLYAFSVDGTSRTTLFERAAPTTVGLNAAVAPDGSRLWYLTRKEEEGEALRLFALRPDGTEDRRISNPALSGDIVEAFPLPYWSPDGAHVAYRVRPAGGVESALAVAAPDGSGSIALTGGAHPPYHEAAPRAWADDGSGLLYQTTGAATDASLYAVSTDGFTLVRVSGTLPGVDVFRSAWWPGP